MPAAPQNFYKKLLGRNGEDKVVRYLKKNGYEIIKRNYSCSQGEADIISKKDGVLIFTEVKTRFNDDFGRPAEAVGYYKQQKYRRIAEYYLLSENWSDVAVRFDVAEVMGKEINYIENAF